MVDPELIASAQRGDAEAFASLIDASRRLVIGLCYAEMGDWDTAEDCAQEVFVRIHARLGTLRDRAKFTAWLRTVVRHVCISEKRRPHRRAQSLETMEERHGSTLAHDGAGDVRRGLDRRALGERLADLVGNLPPTQRRVLVLRHFRELSIAEIAQLTDLTPASVRTMLCRARVSLRRLIERRDPSLRTPEP